MSIKKIIDVFYKDEQRHWEESNKPVNHIFHSLDYLNNLTAKVKEQPKIKM